MKRTYNIINNSLGWLMFAIAAVTYLLTVEPTASFWDCPEFISQGYKLEIGHPPGNPIFILTARFFINFVSSPDKVALAVNVMSALLSALTILLLFWTITHLTRSLVVALNHREDKFNLSLAEKLVVFGSGVVGSLAYTWSDTFWFSAVEGEVYAFSSFCTALVFWLILKWENRADDPSSDRYLILIAYIIGVSIAVHLLNLLCIPAIVLVFYYRKWKNTNVKGSLLALLASFAIIVLILYGLVPGFVKVAQWFELFFVNTLGLSYNSGVLVYVVLVLALIIWAVSELYRQTSTQRIKISFFLAIIFSGILFIGGTGVLGWLIPIVLIGALAAYLFKYCRSIPVRALNVIIMSVLMIFIGYSSYAVILIRSNAQTPIDQNSPDNVFALASYLSREQYGQRPLLYGQTFDAEPIYKLRSSGAIEIEKTPTKPVYTKVVKQSPDEPDKYVAPKQEYDYTMTPSLNMLFPRLYDDRSKSQYISWLGLTENDLARRQVMVTPIYDEKGNPINTLDGQNYYSHPAIKPTFMDNIRFFLDYQLNYMYWRYFMWNFAGRQNDIQGQGEITHGNWISGIPFIDNPRLGDQSLLPDELGEGNKGHNVFYLLPLLLGIIGLLWQAYSGKKGIEQFWVVFFLFFMTGIAIVIYLNQTPGQPRERDYAFAGSFYAFAIWIGLGVAGLWRMFTKAVALKPKKGSTEVPEDPEAEKKSLLMAAVASVLGIIVPLQMVSQTWDDHDRSGRYAARDFGMNYLSSVEPNAIIFTNGDNDTFPLWYAQETEGYRTDVRVVNLSYLTTDWYINQLRRQAYESAPIPMSSNPSSFAYGRRQAARMGDNQNAVTVDAALADFFSPANDNPNATAVFNFPNMYVKVDREAVKNSGLYDYISDSEIIDSIPINFLTDEDCLKRGGIYNNKIISADIINSLAKEGWKRPVYIAMTVPDEYYLQLQPYMRNTGMAYQITPSNSGNDPSGYGVATDKMYDNVMNKFRWGGYDKVAPGKSLYTDETIGRMITSHRSSLINLASALTYEGAFAAQALQDNKVDLNVLSKADADSMRVLPAKRYDMARNVLALMETKFPASDIPYAEQLGLLVANAYIELGTFSGNKTDIDHGLLILQSEILRYAQYIRFYQSLSPTQYAMLSASDMRIDQRIYGALLKIYAQYASDKEVSDLFAKLEGYGIDMQRLVKFVAQPTQEQAEVATAEN